MVTLEGRQLIALGCGGGGASGGATTFCPAGLGSNPGPAFSAQNCRQSIFEVLWAFSHQH